MRPDIKWRISSLESKKLKSKSFLSLTMIAVALLFLALVYLFSLYDQRLTLLKFKEAQPVSIALRDFHPPRSVSNIPAETLIPSKISAQDQQSIQKILQSFNLSSPTFILAQIAAQDQHHDQQTVFFTSAEKFHAFLSQTFLKINEKVDGAAIQSSSLEITPENTKSPTILPPDAPFYHYAKPFQNPEKLSLITLVILKLGEETALTQKALNILPKEITFGYLLYDTQVAASIQTAFQAGHEILMMIPMEPMDYPDSDPGAGTLLTGLDPSQLQLRLNNHLQQGKEIIGITNFLGSRFAFSTPDLEVLIEALKAQGLMILDANTSPRSLISDIAQNVNLPYAHTTLQIDADLSSEEIKSKLFMLEQLALKEGKAIGYGFVNDLTLETVTAWSKTLSERGIVLAPLTHFVGKK